jgi:hypothetical protein
MPELSGSAGLPFSTETSERASTSCGMASKMSKRLTSALPSQLRK